MSTIIVLSRWEGQSTRERTHHPHLYAEIEQNEVASTSNMAGSHASLVDCCLICILLCLLPSVIATERVQEVTDGLKKAGSQG